MAVVYKTDGKMELLPDAGLDTLGRAVGGVMELRIARLPGMVLVVNGRARAKGLPRNTMASSLAQGFGAQVFGDAVLVEVANIYRAPQTKKDGASEECPCQASSLAPECFSS
jgi:hypothetical protein